MLLQAKLNKYRVTWPPPADPAEGERLVVPPTLAHLDRCACLTPPECSGPDLGLTGSLEMETGILVLGPLQMHMFHRSLTRRGFQMFSKQEQ